MRWREPCGRPDENGVALFLCFARHILVGRGYAMSFVRQGIKSVCKAVVPRRMFLTHGPVSPTAAGLFPGRQEIALTFDDGPEPETTPKLLGLLEKWRITATFFVIGEKAARHRDIVQRIVAAGHGLGNHSYTHSEPHQTSTSHFLDEVRKTRDLLEEISNQPCTLVRPPKGMLSVGKQLGLWRERMTVALWNTDPRDYQMRSQQQAMEWVGAYQPRCGDIILLHDNHPWAGHIVEALATDSGHMDRVSYVRLSEWV